MKNIKQIFATLVVAGLVSLGFAAAASATVITPTAASGSGAATLEASFLGSYSSVTTETFAGYAANTQGPLTLSIGTITGGGYVGDDTTFQAAGGEYSVGSDLNYWSNGTPGTGVGKNDFTLTFDTATKAFGFYTTDLQDTGGRILLTFTTASGDVTVNLYDLVGSQSTGTTNYFTFTSDSPISSVTFHASGNDGFAIDNVSVGATPIPGAVWLLGSGLLGLVGLRRRVGN